MKHRSPSFSLHRKRFARAASLGLSIALACAALGVFAATSTHTPSPPHPKAATAPHSTPAHTSPAPKPAVKPVAQPVATGRPAAPAPQPAPPTVSKPAAVAAASVAQAAASPGASPSQLSPAPVTTTTSTPDPSTSTTTSQTPAPDTSAPATAPAFPAATISYTSTNWSGYLATSGSYTAVAGGWTAPAPAADSAPSSADSSWIGIGGVSSDDLIQVGTENVYSASGKLSTSAFYELLPDYPVYIAQVLVHPGDAITASLNETSPGQWSIHLSDTTDGQSYTTTVSYTSTHSSAEWIEEDPMYSSGSLVPFDDFGSVTFTAATMTGTSGTPTSLAAGKAQAIMMVDSSHQPVATPSGLGTDGSSFMVTRN